MDASLDPYKLYTCTSPRLPLRTIAERLPAVGEVLKHFRKHLLTRDYVACLILRAQKAITHALKGKRQTFNRRLFIRGACGFAGVVSPTAGTHTVHEPPPVVSTCCMSQSTVRFERIVTITQALVPTQPTNGYPHKLQQGAC